MIAVIGDLAASAGSIGLHRSLGFEDAGVGRGVRLQVPGRWVDMVWMQKTLRPWAIGRAADRDGLAL